MNNKLIITACLIITLLIVTGCDKNSKTINQKEKESITEIGNLKFNYILDYAEGDCKGVVDCKKVTYGCSKIICTNNPDKYQDIMTDCAIDEKQPNIDEYNCGCVPNEYKCGWIKK